MLQCRYDLLEFLYRERDGGRTVERERERENERVLSDSPVGLSP